MFKRLLLLAAFSSQAVLAQRYERLIETRTISNHEIVGAEYDASTNAVFILSNVTNQNGNGLLAKVNSVNGDTIWSKFVAPTVQQENFKGLYKSSNALFAYGLRTFQSAQFAFIAKLDFNGDTIWTKHYKTLATTACTNPHITINGLTELANGDLVLVGRNNACDRAVLLKTNSLGVISLIKEYDQWLQNIYSPLWEFYGIESDGTNYFVSARYGKAQQNWDYYKGIWKLDLNGDLVTNFNSQFAQNSEIFGFKRDAVGNFYLLGQHNPISQNVGILEKFNATGASLWTYTPSGVTIQWSGITDIEFDASNDVFVSGYFQKQNQSVDQFAAKINSSTGAEIWIKQYGYGDNGYGRELVKLGGNFLMVSDEGFGWDARDQYGVIENSPPHSTHAVIQVFNANGQVGKFKKTPWQDSKQGKSQFFAYAAFNFNSSYWSNVNLVPVTLASATGGTSGYNAWNNNYNFEIWMSSQNQNGNGIGTFYFTAADKNGDVRSSDTMEVLQPSSFSGEDIYGSIAVAACSGDSLKLVPSILITGSTYKWLYFGTTGTSPGVKVGTGLNFYAKQKGYYALRHILGNLDSAQSNSILLTIETDQVQITSSEYPQTFWVSGTASDSTSKAAPNLVNWSTNKHLHQWVAPFGRYRQSNVQQYYYSAAELSARGLSAGSRISEIAFELAQSYTGGSLEDFKIAFRWTTASTNAWITFNSSDIVYDNYWQNPSTSTGSLSFDINDQTWNGTSSLMVQVSYRVSGYNPATDVNPVFKLESSTINSSRVLFAQNTSLGLIGNTGAGNKTFMYRPLTRFKIGYPAKTDTIVSCGTGIALSIQNTGYQALTWNNGATTPIRQITSPTLVSVTMVDGNFCVSQDTVRVIFNPNTNQIVSSALKVGPGGTITLSAQPRSINLWSNGAAGNATTITSSGKYKLTSINSDGCTYIDSVTVEVLTTPAIYKGDRGAYRGTALSGFTYMGKIGTSHVYYSNSCSSWNNAIQSVNQLGAKFWYPKSASDNAAIKALYNSKVGCCGGRWIGVYRPTSTSSWRDLSGNQVNYTNWDVNYNQNGLYGFIEFSWSGFWNASTDGTNDCREFFISFDDESSVAGVNETACDSLKLWTPEGFDSYQWTLGTTSLTTTSNEIWAKNTGVYSVNGVYSGTTYSGSNAVSLTVNESPAVGIINKSGTVDLNGSNSIKLKATYPAGSMVTWYVNGVAQTAGQDSIISNVVGWHRVVVANNGCTTKDSIRLFQPIYVAKTGNNQNIGTLQQPYLTIQHAINQSSAGQKIYVLPGTYAEKVLIDRPVVLQSNYDRLGDTAAMHTTIIEPGTVGLITSALNTSIQASGGVNIIEQGNSRVEISGFTIRNYVTNYSGDWHKSSQFNIYNSDNVLVENVKMSGATQGQGQGCCNAAVVFEVQYSDNVKFDNVRIVNNGTQSQNGHRMAYLNNSKLKFTNSRIVNNVQDRGMHLENTELEVENSLYSSNIIGDEGSFILSGGNNTLVWNYATARTTTSNGSAPRLVNLLGTNNKVAFLNSVVRQDVGHVVFNSGTANQLVSQSSVLGIQTLGGSTSGITVTQDSLSTFNVAPQLFPNNRLMPSSPAIGIGRTGSTVFNKNYPMPNADLAGVARPNPTGSNADAGAYESALAQGELDLSIASCGYQATATVLNSSNYQLTWSGPGGFSSSSLNPTLPVKGIYQVTLIAVDRQDTLVKTLNLNNPLEFTVTSVKDVCESVSSTSGSIQVSTMKGGTIYQLGWGDYYLRLYKNGAQVWQNNIYNGPTNVQTIGGLSTGIYVVRLEDAIGCYVYDTVELDSKIGRKAFVSTTGSNSNAGTLASPYANVRFAVSQACDRDTIIILDGVYNEDSIYVNKALVIGSQYILDGNLAHINATKFIDSEDATFYYGGFNSSNIADTNSSQLVGLTIEGGENPHVDQWYGHGGAVSVWNSVVKLNRLVLKNNTAKDGGAIGLMGHGFTAVVANCTIEGNTAYNSGGGLTANLTGDLWIRSTSFKNNTANSEGGGLWNQSNLIMSDVIIEGNTAQTRGGFYSSTISPWSSGTKRWSRVIVRNNVANSEFGGGYFQKSGSNSQFILDNVLIVNNAAQNYPGIHFGGYDDNRISIINSTIYGNTGSGTSQAAKNNVGFGDNTRIRLLNSIIGRSGGAAGYSFYANNCGTKYLMADASSVIVGGASSIYEDQCGGQLVKSLTGIKTSVPYFTDPENGDYSLKSFSSLIGAGLASNSLGITTVSPNIAPVTLTATSKDVFGGARPNPAGSSIDIGAIESPLGVGLPGINVVAVGNGVCQNANGSATVNLVQINGQPTGAPSISWVKLGDATWTPQSTTTISNLTSGSYQVTLTVGTSVFIDTAVIATAPALSIVNNSLLANCFGDNNGTLKFSIQGGSPFTGGTYKYDIQQLTKDGGVATWNDNSTQERSANFMATQRSSGTYRISVTDAKGCVFVDTLTLGYRNALPMAQIIASGPLTICEGEAVSLDATTQNITDTYSWSDGSNLSVNTVGTSGSWSVTVTDTAGCWNSDTVQVNVSPIPTLRTGTPPAQTGGIIGADYAYLGSFNGNHYYIYKYSNSISWSQARLIAQQFGGHLWTINDAAEQAAVTALIQSHPDWYGEAFNGAYFDNGTWKWVTGEPFTYFNWGQNQANNGNGTQIRVQFNWGGQWERYGYQTDQQKFIIEFPEMSRTVSLSEAFCDSVTVFAPEGFDSYTWKNTSNNNAVVGTSRSLTVTSSMAVKVEGTLNKSNGTSCTLESQTHTITINATPTATIVNHSGTTDLYGNDTVVLGASVASGITWNWYAAGSSASLSTNDTLLVTAPNYYVLSAINAGCERRDSVSIDEPLFVSISGSNTTGNGSFAAPYRTIQKGVNQAPSGGKVYVLPGNYVESVVVTKPVKIYSDYERLGSSTAIGQTKITSQNGNFCVAIRMDSAGAVQNFTKQNMHISGFTIQGKNASNDMGAIDICPAPNFDWNNISKQKGEVLISNVDFTNNTTQANNAAAFASRGNEVHTYFENVKVRNSNLGVDPRGVLSFWQTKGGTFNNAQIFGNDGIIFNVDGQNMTVTFNNTAIFNNDIKGTTWGGYFRIQGNNNTLEFLNSTLSGNIMTSQDARMFRTDNGSGTKVILKNSILNTSGNPVYSGQVSFDARHSLLPLTSILALADFTYYDTTNVHSSVARVQGYELLPNSPAIGIGSLLYASATDIDGKNRPLPAGSNPDAGAFESNLAVGDLDLAITSCGYQVTATVLNSKNYTVTWSGPGGFSSTLTSPLLPIKGMYQATLIALDRQDTIVRTLNLNNPLEFTITSVKDVCEGVGSNSGSISWGNITGGVNNSNPNEWWKKKTSILNSNGSHFDGEWWVDNNQSWSTTRSGMPSGTFIVKVIDGASCAVYDTVVIGSQESNTYFISTSGSDSASGTASNPLKTISEALGRACDGDTIILEDGRHYENVILNNMSPSLTIASRYLLDGDTNHIRNAIVDGSDLNPVFHISDMNNRGTSDTLKLYGFTVTNGLANSGWNGGGGISARWSNVSIVKMHVVENRSGQNGGGIGIWECDLKLKDVLIKDNFATQDGGGLHLQYINNDLLNSNVRLVGNQASNGGGLYYSHGLGNTGQVYELDRFEVYNNYATNQGGGIYFGCWSGEADVQLSNSKVIGNRADQQAGGVVVQSNNADFNFVNVILAKNEADYAGAIRVNNSKVHLIHSTVYSNKHKLGSQSSVLNLAVLVENQSTLKLYNSILGGQGTGGKTVFIQDNQSFFEIVSGQLGGGVSNTVQAPNTSQIIYSSSSPNYTNQQVFLKDPNGGDYSLAKVSQAIGRGLSSFTGATFPATDIFGNNRPNMFGSDPDFGAIESSDTAASFGVAFVINDNNACNTSIGQITAFPQNGSGAYSYSWTALSGGIISNPTGSGASHTIANLFTGLYKVTVTDVVTNATFTDTAEVRGDSPLVLNKTVVDEGCQGTNSGSISIDVVGGSGFYTYTWLLPNGGGTLNTKNISNLAPGVYSVTVTDNKGCSVSTTDTVGTAHAQPNLVITSQIIKAGGTTVNGSNDVRMCIGDQVVFNAGPGFSVYEWNKSDGLNTEYTQTVSSYVSETYSVFVEDTNGCSTTGTAKIFVVYEPNVYASNVNRTMGQQFQQVTSYVRGDTTAVSGSVNNDVSPYNAQGNSLKKSQFVISASELQGAGLTENTTINSLAFDVVNPAGVAFQAYKIKLAHTTAQQLGSWQSPVDQQEVFAIPVYAPVQGWNTHNFTSSFAWNGVDNLLVEVCYTPIGNSMNSASVRINQVATGNTVTNYSYSANTCASPVMNWQMGSSNWRPTVRFGIDKVEVLDTIRVCDFTTLNTTDDYDTYTWYVNGVASPTAALALNLTSPASVVLAATDAASSCVMYSDTFYVALDSTPSVLATSNIVGAVCAGDSVVLSTPSAGLASYLWSNGDTAMTTTVFESGSYILEARSANGCAGSDTVVVTVNTPPTVVVKLNGKTLTATDGSLAAKANTCVQSVLLPFGENFEDSLYVWTQSATDQLDWTFNYGATNTQFSGPNGDFTTTDSSGNYYYLDRAGANSDDNKEAHLISPCVQMVGANKPYLTFGYHMFNGLYNPANPSSDNMGTLRIEIQSTDDAANYWVPLWSKTGHQGSGWKSDTVDLTPYAGQTIRLRVVGKAGVGGPRSEMAIDGISIIDTANSFANTAGRISADIICEGDVLVAQTISNGSTQFSYVWNTGDTTSTLKVDSTGYYFVSVMDENGCSVHTDSVWIEVSPIPNNALTVTGDLDNCYNETVAVTIQAPLSYAKYSWFSNDTTLVPTGTATTLVSMQGLAIGNYAVGVRIFDSIGCAAISDTVYVNRFVQPMIQDSVVSTLCFGDSTGAITVTPITGLMTFSWSNGDSTSSPSGLASGTYQVVFTDIHGCSDTSSIFVPQPTELIPTSTVQDVVCNNETSGSLVLNISGATSPYWLDWASTGVDSGLTRVTLVLDMRSVSNVNSPSVSIVGVPSNIPMTEPYNDGIYYVTLEQNPGSTMYYRFFNGSSPELVPLSCGINPPSLTTAHRSLVVGQNDTTLNRVCFASCVDCDGQVAGARSSVLVGTSTAISNQGSGTVTLLVTDANGCLVTLVDTIAQPDAINLQLDTIVDVSCPQAGDGSVQLTTTGGIMPYAFDWSNGDTIEDLLNVNEGTYLLTVTDMNGCSDTASYEIMAPMPYNFEEICMMTVDSLTGKNQVVWNKTPGQRTMEYQIFKETNVAGQYAQIGTVPYLNMSVFTDVNSVPQQQPDRYKIVAVDSCGSVSDTSDLHRTIHLQSSFGSGGEVNLAWTDYEGRTVQTYDIFRWVSAGNLVQIGSVSGATTTFSDLNPPVAPNVYYNVRAIFAGGACAPAAGKTNSYESARSNILDQTGIGMPDMPWKGLARMYPNPTTSVVRIEVPEAGFTVRVTNLLGQLISEVSAQEAELVLDLSHVAAGMYQVELFREGQVMSIDKLHVVH